MKKMLAVVDEKINSGQSLIEAIVAMAVALLIISGLVSAVIVAVKNSQFARNQSLATQYASEGIEWIRSQRDNNWTNFYLKAGPVNDPYKYCLNNIILSWPPNTPCGSSDYSLGNNVKQNFKRQANISIVDATKILVIMTVSWSDPSGIHKVELNSYFTKW